MAEQMAPNKATFTLSELYDIFDGSERRSMTYNWQVQGVVTDSRQVENGNIFVALEGEKFDGHDYLPAVARIPKVVAIVSRLERMRDLGEIPYCEVEDTLRALGQLARYHRQRFEIPVVAVTGSYGKTSTRALIYAALSAGGETLTSQANFNNEIGLPMTLFQLETKHQFAVLEMGMRGLNQIDYLAKIAQPTVGVITNIGPQHIELLGDLDGIARAKAELIENLPADGLAILPADSPFLSMLKGKAPCRVVTFGLAKDADYRVQNVRTESSGNIAFKLLDSNGVTHQIALPIPGAHNAVNATAAFAVAHQLGVTPDAIVVALQSAQLPGARMRIIKASNGLTLIDDCYNAGPDSMRAALQTLRDFPSNGRRIAVLGAMRELGEYSDDEHRKIGELAQSFCDFIIAVGSETRPILEAVAEGENTVYPGWSPDAKQSISLVQRIVKPGDVILVKGSRSVGLEVVVEALQKFV